MIVVKVGGGAGVDLDSVCADVSALVHAGQQVVVVHGTSAAADRLVPPPLRHGRSLFGSSCVLSQERVGPRSDLGMVPQQQVSSARQGQELGTRNVLGGVLAKAERVEMVIPGVNDQGWRRDLFHKVARVGQSRLLRSAPRQFAR